MAVKPTKGSCTFAMAFQIERGTLRRRRRSTVSASSSWDSRRRRWGRATGRSAWSPTSGRPTEQREAITAIASGAARRADGGAVGPDRQVPRRRIGADSLRAQRREVVGEGRRRLVDMAAQGAMGINPGATEPLHLENTGHPAADRFALAHAVKSHVERARPLVGRRQRKEQRPVRAVRLAECLAHHRRSRHSPRRDRFLIWACIALVTSLAWAYLVHLDRQMSSSMAHDRMMAEMGMTMDMPRTYGGCVLHIRHVGRDDGRHDGRPAAPMLLLFAGAQAGRGIAARCRWRCRCSGSDT